MNSMDETREDSVNSSNNVKKDEESMHVETKQYENSFSTNINTYEEITKLDSNNIVGYDRTKKLSLKKIILTFDQDELKITKGKDTFSYSYDQVQIAKNKPVYMFNFYQKAILDYAIIRTYDGTIFRIGFVNLAIRQIWLFFALSVIGIGMFMFSPILAMVLVSIISVGRNPITTMFINEKKNDVKSRLLFGNANYKNIYKGEVLDYEIIENINKSQKLSRIFGALFIAALLGIFFFALSIGPSAVILNGGFIDSNATDANVTSTLNQTKNYILSTVFTIIFTMIIAFVTDRYLKKHLDIKIDPLDMQKSQTFFNRSIVIKVINEKNIKINILIGVVLISILSAFFWNTVFKNMGDSYDNKNALNEITQDEININNVTSDDISNYFESNANLAYQFIDAVELQDNVALNSIKCENLPTLNYSDYLKFTYKNEGKTVENLITEYQSYSFNELTRDDIGYSYATKVFRKANPGLGLDYINIITRHKTGEISCIFAFVASDDKEGLEQQTVFGDISKFKLGSGY